MYMISIDNKNTKFVIRSRVSDDRKEFDGTVAGALEFLKYQVSLHENGESVMNSSDYNHPNEFPNFEKHSIDIAAGYLDGAVEDGIIKLR